ncbi:MAG TPA: FecR domain-containing protein [Chitinophagaceae bacterium]|nr:FecR domain-containing protein [Chitinophagaceae bacterium]
MSLSRERIDYLLRAYTFQTATDAEERELFEWIAAGSGDSVINDHINALIRSHAGEKFPEVNWEDLYRRVLDRVGEKVTPVRRIRWYHVAAAVLILLAAGGSLYVYSRRQPLPAKVVVRSATHYQNDIHPGSTKAVLQAGGLQVVLDKKDTSFTLAGNKVRISKGNVRIADDTPIRYTLSTPRGGEYRLVLSDGTKVWLNAATKLVYPSVFTGATRAVTLEGEAYFEVHTDATHPFIVHTAIQNIKVLGTSFNVHAYRDEKSVVTTLVDGSLQVKGAGKTLQLQPGQQAQSDVSGELQLNPEADVQQAIAWKNGYFRFDKADLHAIMQRLSRWYDVDIHYEKNLRIHYFGAIMSRDNNISQILGMLEATGEVHFKIRDKEVVVMP